MRIRGTNNVKKQNQQRILSVFAFHAPIYEKFLKMAVSNMKIPKNIFKEKELLDQLTRVGSYDGERIGYMNVLFDKVENVVFFVK